MRNFILLIGAAALSLNAPALAQGKGNDKGGGGGKGDRGAASAKGGGERGNGGAKDRGPGEAKGRGSADKGNGRSDQSLARGNGGGPAKSPERGGERRAGRDDRDRGNRGRTERADRGQSVDVARIRNDVGDRRGTLIIDDRGRDPRYVTNLIPGCPPGLAKKNNGCLPPGQARKLGEFGGPFGDWYRYSRWYRDDGYDWRYANGYVYRVDGSTNLIGAFLPLLGGALFGGNVWPTGYSNYDVPDYYDNYYGYNEDYDYRYADGAIFAVDPRDNSIESIAGLLTGNRWAIGSPAPLGYDLYNVPMDWRDRYYDDADSRYRYSDGYIYEIDPTTQLVQAVFELLA